MRQSACVRSRLLCVLLAAFLPSLGTASSEWNDTACADLAASLIKQHQMSDTQLTADGGRTAFVVREPAVGREVRSNIWVHDGKTAMARRFTAAGSSDSHPRWSPDGSELAFISERGEGPPQIHVIRADGGEARSLTTVNEGVRSYEWSPTGKEIAFVSPVPVPKPANPDEDWAIGSLEHPPLRLKILDTSSGNVRQVIDEKWAVGLYAWLPDGRGLVVGATDEFVPERAIDRVFVFSLDTGAMRELGRIDSVEFSEWSVSPDGKFLAYVGSSIGPTLHDLFMMPLTGGPVRNLTGAGSASGIDRPVEYVSWLNADKLVFVTADGFGSAIRTVDTRGRASVLHQFPQETVRALDAVGQKLVYEKASAVKPAEMWIYSDRKHRPITDLHAGFPELVAPELIRYPGTDGFEIEAAVYYPKDRRERAPTVALIHGGPTSRFAHVVTNWAQMMAAGGYVVFAPNIRGSTGYGEAFMMANREDWGGGDFRDVMSGIDHLIAKGIADADKLAIVGWSYGGYLSAWATTQTNRFKAALLGAPMLDLNVQWSAELPEIVAYDTWYLGTPWERQENFQRMAPATHVSKVVTPSLLLVGEKDPVNHPLQNRMYFRALRMRGIPSELVVYPREAHSFREEAHARDVLVRTVDWLDRYLQ